MSQYVTPFSNALAASATETLVQLLAAANRHVKIKEISIGFDAIAGAAPPLIELLRQSDAGTSSAAVENPWDGEDSATAEVTATDTFTAEPTPGLVLGRWRTWALDILYPLGDEPRAARDTRIAVRVTTLPGQTPTCSGHIRYEE